MFELLACHWQQLEIGKTSNCFSNFQLLRSFWEGFSNCWAFNYWKYGLCVGGVGITEWASRQSATTYLIAITLLLHIRRDSSSQRAIRLLDHSTSNRVEGSSLLFPLQNGVRAEEWGSPHPALEHYCHRQVCQSRREIATGFKLTSNPAYGSNTQIHMEISVPTSPSPKTLPSRKGHQRNRIPR